MNVFILGTLKLSRDDLNVYNKNENKEDAFNVCLL